MVAEIAGQIHHAHPAVLFPFLQGLFQPSPRAAVIHQHHLRAGGVITRLKRGGKTAGTELRQIATRAVHGSHNGQLNLWISHNVFTYIRTRFLSPFFSHSLSSSGAWENPMRS